MKTCKKYGKTYGSDVFGAVMEHGLLPVFTAGGAVHVLLVAQVEIGGAEDDKHVCHTIERVLLKVGDERHRPRTRCFRITPV